LDKIDISRIKSDTSKKHINSESTLSSSQLSFHKLDLELK